MIDLITEAAAQDHAEAVLSAMRSAAFYGSRFDVREQLAPGPETYGIDSEEAQKDADTMHALAFGILRAEWPKASVDDVADAAGWVAALAFVGYTAPRNGGELV